MAMASDAGPETTISETFFNAGSAKSTCWRRSVVIVTFAAATSPRPLWRAVASSLRPTGTKAT